jgi:dihydroflavonol-4-reductase
MSLVLLTGGTGTVGSAVAAELVRRGRSVRALVRSIERARPCLPDSVELVVGDVTDARSVRAAMEGCDAAYHGSGLPEQWLRDPGQFQRVNVDGTRNMIEAALDAKVKSFVYTSTIDVFTMPRGEPFDESTLDPRPKGTHYERSKQDADRLVVAALERGLPARFLHPAAVYGPSPVTTPGLNDFLRRLARGEVPMLLPGGMPVVESEDCARGHVLAEEKAPVGARFILSDTYLSLAQIAAAVALATGRGRVPRVMPMAFAKLVSVLGELASPVLGAPLIPAGQLHFVATEAHPSGDRARRELGWTTVPFREGLARTLDALRKRGEI